MKKRNYLLFVICLLSFSACTNKRDMIKAKQEAAVRGEVVVQYELAECYYNGYNVTQDYSKAVKWYYKAANGGDKNAQYKLALCYI